MGIDCLDIVFRLEKEFGLMFHRGQLGWPEDDARRRKPPLSGFTAGQLHEQVCNVLSRQGLEIPPDSWVRVRGCIATALQLKPEQVRREDRLIEDLGVT